MKRHLDRLLESLILVRLGQELGSDTHAARQVAAVVDLLINAIKGFLS